MEPAGSPHASSGDGPAAGSVAAALASVRERMASVRGRMAELRGARPPRQADARRARMIADGLLRVVVLVALIIGSGFAIGYAVGYPLRQLDLGGPPAVVLDQPALAGSFDPALALVRLEDMPKGWQVGDPVLNSFALVGASYCGQSAEVDGQLGDRLTAAFSDPQNAAVVVSEVVRVRRQQDAGGYVREVSSTLDGCPNGRFFRVEGDKRVEVQIIDNRDRQPVEDYDSRLLRPVAGGPVQIVTYFQVGDAIVAIAYNGPPNPPKELLHNVEKEILYRVAPKQFSRSTKVSGATGVPDQTSTTQADAAGLSPTSSPPAPPTPPQTEAPTPTFSAPTTTRAKRSNLGAPNAAGTAPR